MEWVLAIALLMAPALLLVAYLSSWLQAETRSAATAQEVARAVATADDWEAGIQEAQKIEERLERRLVLEGNACPEPAGCVRLLVRGSLVRGGEIVVEVAQRIPGLTLPFVGEVAGFWATARHREVVDPYRSLP